MHSAAIIDTPGHFCELCFHSVKPFNEILVILELADAAGMPCLTNKPYTSARSSLEIAS
jgi:hypothetical protein